MTSTSTDQPRKTLPARLGLSGGAAALKVRFIGVIVFLALLGIAFSALTPRFATLDNGRSILFTAAILAVAAVGQAIVVLTGNLDLSVGAIMGMAAYVIYDIAGQNPVLQPYVVVLAILLGAILGAFNGFLVAVLQIPSIVATLGTLSIYRGFVSFYANATEVTSGQLPPWMRMLATASWFGLPA
jgi:rhamnose transport system permease protein